YDSLVERALDFTGDPALGLRVGARAKSLLSSLPAHLVLQAASLRDGLSLAARYYQLMADEPPYTLEEGAKEIVIKVVGVKGPPRCRRFGAELAAAGMYRAICHFVPHARPRLVAFEHEEPAYRSEYTGVFHGLERFGQPFTGVIVDRELV